MHKWIPCMNDSSITSCTLKVMNQWRKRPEGIHLWTPTPITTISYCPKILLSFYYLLPANSHLSLFWHYFIISSGSWHFFPLFMSLPLSRATRIDSLMVFTDLWSGYNTACSRCWNADLSVSIVLLFVAFLIILFSVILLHARTGIAPF